MPVSSRALVELLLLGPTNERRQFLDSPVLGDVFIAYAVRPSQRVDLLITPDKASPAGPVAFLIASDISDLEKPGYSGEDSNIAYLHGLIAARLFFEELLQVVVPMTSWWNDLQVRARLNDHIITSTHLKSRIQAVINWVRAENDDAEAFAAQAFASFTALDGFLTLAGIILWAATQTKKGTAMAPVSAGDALARLKSPTPVVTLLAKSLKRMSEKRKVKTPQVWQIALNRKPIIALDRSVPSVKGDAARTLFNVKCDRIHWAVLDSGIDATHPVFQDASGECRIIKAYDFTSIRRIVNLDNLDVSTPSFKNRLRELRAGREREITVREGTHILQRLAEDAANDRRINWELVERFISIDPRTPPAHGHGTHVAGIIGAYNGDGKQYAGFCNGLCPDIKLYDFRVFSKTSEDTEFAIIAALQFVRYLNDRSTYMKIHGVNLSLSIPHDVRNYACGRTPICMECERLVESGVVVVAPAGNLGYTFATSQGSYGGYTAFSITDPGNAESVITVGATNPYRPHTYGVSFFSSRGPTGDGRLKPDLVAPGERIESCLPEGGWGELDGTSMAAPHVSGAAAMLMARYDDLIGEPRKIKKILCDTATDLGRDRSFQGHGMLDVLRALQSM